MNIIKNKAGRELPVFIEGYGDVKPYAGAFATEPTGYRATTRISKF